MKEEVQEYRDINQMTKEELNEYLSKPYKAKSGIVVKRKFNPDGESATEHWKRYLRRKLEG